MDAIVNYSSEEEQDDYDKEKVDISNSSRRYRQSSTSSPSQRSSSAHRSRYADRDDERRDTKDSREKSEKRKKIDDSKTNEKNRSHDFKRDPRGAHDNKRLSSRDEHHKGRHHTSSSTYSANAITSTSSSSTPFSYHKDRYNNNGLNSSSSSKQNSRYSSGSGRANDASSRRQIDYERHSKTGRNQRHRRNTRSRSHSRSLSCSPKSPKQRQYRKYKSSPSKHENRRRSRQRGHRSSSRSISRSRSRSRSRSLDRRSAEPVERARISAHDMARKLNVNLFNAIEQKTSSAIASASIAGNNANGNTIISHASPQTGQQQQQFSLSTSSKTASIAPLMSLPLIDTASKRSSLVALSSIRTNTGNTITNDQSSSVIQLPSYYNPSIINPTKYAEQVQKRKLLWGSKKNDDTASKWGNAQFSQDSDGKVASKFMRLMGIKGGTNTASGSATTSTSASTSSNSNISDVEQQQQQQEQPSDIKSREKMFSSMEQQYEVARQVTHTMRGVGLGFSTQPRTF